MIPKETSWGNPVPTAAYFKGVKAAGFRSIRIPVAWSQYVNANGSIDPVWLAHVKHVVELALHAKLYVLINVHWDGGWIVPTRERESAVEAKLKSLWDQIARYFRDVDSHLLFAGTNEIGVPGICGPPSPENAEVQNAFNQVFVSTVRSSGGLNSTRMLVVQGYNTDIDATVKANRVMPRDSAASRLMLEVHYYSPYNFVLSDKSDVWQWGKTATDPKATDTWGNEEYVDAEFSKVKSTFVDQGIPVILGEYSAGMKMRFPGMDRYRKLWDEYVTRSAALHGMVPMLWDTGDILDRVTGNPKDVDLIARVVGTAAVNKETSR